jgi:ubiquitin-conjugating enzyme E2 Q
MMIKEARERDEKEDEIKLDNQLEEIERKFIGQGSEMGKKRILNEYKNFMRSKELENFSIEFYQGDNIYKWEVKIHVLKFDLEKKLREDFFFCEGENPTLNLEMTFPENYPFESPFIRVVSPKFRFRTGHVTIGGSVCMESITPSGWSSARSIESIFIEIISIIFDPESKARLDRASKGLCYS